MGVAKIDKLSRKTEQALQIYSELQARLESCDIPNLDKFTLTLFMAIADQERKLIGLRSKATLDEKRKKPVNGCIWGNKFQTGLLLLILKPVRAASLKPHSPCDCIKFKLT